MIPGVAVYDVKDALSKLSRISDSLRRRNALQALDFQMQYGPDPDEDTLNARLKIAKDILAAEYKPSK